MNKQQFDSLAIRIKASLLAALVFSPAANAQLYECMLIQSRVIKQTLSNEDIKSGNIAVHEVIVEGRNFGSNPKVYFGSASNPAEILNVGQHGDLDSITLKLPQGTTEGSYKLIVQNTTGPFLDNNDVLNPIFCFGSVRVGVRIEKYSSYSY